MLGGGGCVAGGVGGGGGGAAAREEGRFACWGGLHDRRWGGGTAGSEEWHCKVLLCCGVVKLSVQVDDFLI